MAIYQNKPIRSLTVDVFDLVDGDSAILYNFAKKGEATRHKIITKQDKKTVSKRIDILFEKGFLILRKSTPFRNQSHKSTKYFGLSLKGFLASLRYCNIEDNYLTKKFLKEIKNKSISKLVLNHMKNELIENHSYSSFMGITLDKIKNIHNWIGEFHEFEGFSNDEQKYFENLNYQSIQSLQELMNQTFDNPNTYHYLSQWHSSIEKFSNGMNYSQIMKDLDKQFDNIEPLFGLNIDESYQKIIDKFKKEFKMDLTK